MLKISKKYMHYSLKSLVCYTIKRYDTYIHCTKNMYESFHYSFFIMRYITFTVVYAYFSYVISDKVAIRSRLVDKPNYQEETFHCFVPSIIEKIAWRNYASN